MTTYKLLLLLALCTLSLSQIYSWDPTGNLTQARLTNYWVWFDNMAAHAKLGSTGAGFIYTSACRLDFQNVSSAQSGCTTTIPTPWPCAPDAVLDFGGNGDNVCSYMQDYTGTGFNSSCYLFNYGTNPTLSANTSSTVYVSPLTSNSQCYERTISQSGKTTYNATFQDNAQFMQGILQDVYTITEWYLAAMTDCITNFPSGAQGGYLASDSWDAIYRPATIMGLGYSSSSYKTNSGDPSLYPTTRTLFSFFNDPYWSQNGTGNTSMQDILFQDMYATANNNTFNGLCEYAV
jgi:hypothetical protein